MDAILKGKSKEGMWLNLNRRGTLVIFFMRPTKLKKLTDLFKKLGT
jgi:hypothetical protein